MYDPDPCVRKEAVFALFGVKGAPRPPGAIPVLISARRATSARSWDRPVAFLFRIGCSRASHVDPLWDYGFRMALAPEG